MKTVVKQRPLTLADAFSSDVVLLLLGAAAVSLAVIRATVQSIIIDEAMTYDLFVGRSSPAYCWYPSPNNHVLNSLLMRVFTSAFGLSQLTVRAPALTGAVAYIAAAYLLCKTITNRLIIRVLLFSVLLYNPFISDFFVAARGYSLATAFLMWAIVFAAWSCSASRNRLAARQDPE